MKNIEQVLKEQGICITTTKGNSMEPMLVEGRDKVVVVPPEFPLKKYDVPVYRRFDHYTMHRIIKVTKNGYIICGDNRADLEKDITDSDIIGVLDGFYQGDRDISCNDEEFLNYGKNAVRGLFKRRAICFIQKVTRRLKKIF